MFRVLTSFLMMENIVSVVRKEGAYVVGSCGAFHSAAVVGEEELVGWRW